MTMNAQLLYIASPVTTPQPAVQVNNGGRVILTSIRVCAPTNNNGSVELHHLWRGQTAAATSNAIAYNLSVTSKAALEILTHPLPLSPGESLYVSGDNVTVAIYGIVI